MDFIATARARESKPFWIPQTLKIFALLISFQVIVCSAAEPLMIALDVPPDTLNPHKTVNVEGHIICKQVYHSLIARNMDGSFSPRILSSWSFSSDRKVLRIVLNPKIQFSNGKSVTAADVGESLKRSILSRSNDEVLQISGSSKIKTENERLNGYTIIGEYEASIRFDRPAPGFLNILSELNTAVTLRTPSGELLGTGPYKIKSAATNGPVILELNEKFGGPPGVPTIVKFTFGEPLPNADVAQSSSPTRQRFHAFHEPQVTYLGFNLGHSHLRDLGTRLAVYKALIEVPGPGSIIPRGMLGYDPEKAIQLPAIKGERPKEISISYYLPVMKAWADKLCASAIRSDLACTVKKITSEQALDAKFRRSQLQVFVARLRPSFPSVDDLFQIFYSKNKINFFSTGAVPSVGGFLDKQTERLISETSLEGEQRVEVYHAIDRFVTDQLVAIPLEYGGEKRVYFSNRCNLPRLGVMGILDLDISAIRLADEK